MKKNFLVTQIRETRFYAKHRVLRELIILISSQVDVSTDNRVNIFIGIHDWNVDLLPKNSMNIGIQTEQFFDANGQMLWGGLSHDQLKAACLKFDAILDFTEFNRVAYQNLDKYNRVVFGPYIFPKEKVLPSSEKSSVIYFVGALNERRKQILIEMSKQYSVKIVENEFGQKLNQTLGLSLAVMNIHFQGGVYAEWPRILLAYVNGKILLSEDLGHPLVTGKHYCALGCNLDEVDISEIHDNVWRDFAQKYNFSDFLNSQNSQKIKLQASEVWFLRKHVFNAHINKLMRKLTKALKFY